MTRPSLHELPGRACSTAGALEVVGDRWALLVVREVSLGDHRFTHIARGTGAPRDRLTARLDDLVELGVLERRQCSATPPRSGCHLTASGRDLLPVLQALLQWGDRWVADEPPVTLHHEPPGAGAEHRIDAAWVRRTCGEPVSGSPVHRVAPRAAGDRPHGVPARHVRAHVGRPGTLPAVLPIPPRVVTLVLCTQQGEVLGQLPPFETAEVWWPEVASVVAGARERYGVDVTVLRLLEAERPAPPGGAVTLLAEVERPHRLDLAPFGRALDDSPLRLPYARPGGPARDLAWAAARLEEAGRRPGGRPQQVRTWNLSSLWRLPLEDGVAWLKCVPPFFAHEGAVLDRLAGGPVPPLLAFETGRVLMAEVPGADRYDADLPVLLALVALLVELQAREVGREDELLALGLPDWRGPALSCAVEDVVRRHAQALPSEDRRSLDELLRGLDRRWADLAACGVPDTLVHGDVHPGNARGDAGSLVLLDWGDCGVGHPLLDSPAMLARLDEPTAERVRDAWERAWRAAAPGSDPRRAAALLAPLAAARQAVLYQGFLDRIEPSEHPYHRDDPLPWLRSAAVAARW